MLGIFTKKDAHENLIKGFNRLMLSFSGVQKPNQQQPSLATSYSVIELRHSLGWLRMSLEDVARIEKGKGKSRLDPEGMDIVRSAFHEVVNSAGRLQQELNGKDGERRKKKTPSLGDLFKAINSMDKAVKAASRDAGPTKFQIAVQRMQGEELSQFRMVQDELARLDRRLARELTMQMVHKWYGSLHLDPKNPKHARQVAKMLYLDQLEGQFYTLYYRPKTVSRHLVSTFPIARFPSSEDVMAHHEQFGRPKLMYVAASKPTWRIVMTIDSESPEWEGLLG